MPHSLRLVRPLPPPLRPGTHSAVIRQRVIHYLPAARERWREIRAAWQTSGHKDWSVWEEFESLARSKRFVFAHRQNRGLVHYFGESLIARDLEAEGFTTWATCRLLGKSGLRGVYAEQTRLVERMLAKAGLPCPSAFRHRLAFVPRNPDLTAFHPRHGWRFIEVKVNRDRLKVEQLQTLAFLHDYLPASVEVVRLVPKGTNLHREELSCSYAVLT